MNTATVDNTLDDSRIHNSRRHDGGLERPLPDTQASADHRGLVVPGAGVSGVRLPLTVIDTDGTRNTTVAVADAEVHVPADQRGTHMSRLVETIHALGPSIETADLVIAASAMLDRLDSDAGRLTLRFPWFVAKTAPVSRQVSWLDVEAQYRIRCQAGRAAELSQWIRVPVTTLCPCSKIISKYGAHNQRSYVTVALDSDQPIALAALVATIEAQASSPVYAVLKRADEKHVTEAAYENPKFAEDLVRDIYSALSRDWALRNLSVATENQESIHNHAAYAYIGEDCRQGF